MNPFPEEIESERHTETIQMLDSIRQRLFDIRGELVAVNMTLREIRDQRGAVMLDPVPAQVPQPSPYVPPAPVAPAIPDIRCCPPRHMRQDGNDCGKLESDVF